jgi:hypothetical protein
MKGNHMEEPTLREEILDNQETYLDDMIKRLDQLGRTIERIKAATIDMPITRLKIMGELLYKQEELSLFVNAVERATKLCPAMALNQAYLAQQLGHDPEAFVRDFLAWQEGVEQGVITDDEAEALSIRYRLKASDEPETIGS